MSGERMPSALPKPHTKSPGVYFIGPEDGDVVKIGITNKVHARLADLQVGSPHPLEVKRWVPTPNREVAKLFERRLHEYHQLSRLQGEWFEIDRSMERELNSETVYVQCYGDEDGVIEIDQDGRLWSLGCKCPEVTHRSCGLCRKADIHSFDPHLVDREVTEVAVCQSCLRKLDRDYDTMRGLTAEVTDRLLEQAAILYEMGRKLYWLHNARPMPHPIWGDPPERPCPCLRYCEDHLAEIQAA